jgi:hypothetical protein
MVGGVVAFDNGDILNTNNNPDWIRLYNTIANCVLRDIVRRVCEGLQDITSFHRTWV